LIAKTLVALALLALPAAPALARGLTPADLVSLDRVSDAHASPDGRLVVYDQRATDLAGNRGTHALWLKETSGAGEARLLNGGDGGTSPRWSADGRLVYFLKGGQVWRSAVGSGVSSQVTRLPLGIEAFRVAPGGKLVVSMAVFPDAESPAATKARLDAAAKAGTGRIYDKMFVRHWDAWADGTRNHLFALTLGPDGAASGEPVALTPGLDADVPSKPFGDDADFTLSPDGRTVYFSARIAGKSEPWSTNFDIFAVPADGSAPPRNLTAANLAWDAMPVVSPDGKTLAYSAMARPGFEADKFTVRLMDLATGQSRALTAGWDRSVDALKWSRDGRSLLAPAGEDGATPLFRIDAATGAATAAIPGHVTEFEPLADGSVLYVHDSMAHPSEVAHLPATGAARTLVRLNGERLAGFEPSAAERFSFKGWNGDLVKGWILKPSGYEAGKKYPVAFLIHGGPQSSWSDSWSYRWNPQVFAGRGYAVVMIDPHGSTGYGQAFTDAISNHWGDRPLEDLQKGWAAALKAAPFLDGSRACAAGASYGGYMVNWIAGVWSQPWKCLVVHDGVFDDRLMGYATEELWFSEWEHGGIGKTPWADPAAYEKFNPINHVAKWTKPQLIIHSEKDYRIPVEQGLAAFDALQRQGIESRLLTFPDENHWVLKPANSLQWNDAVLGWLDSHLK
jgi:acylaminoacyl-peptidase